MQSVGKILLATVIVLQIGTGFILNSCILVFSFQHLKNRSNVYSTNLVYSIKGLVNILLQMVLAAENAISLFWPHLFFVREVQITLTFLMLSFIYYSYWLTGWLCAHYCVNISNFTHKLLLGFKRVLLSFLPRLLFLSTAQSLAMSALSIFEFRRECPDHPTNTTQGGSFIFTVYLAAGEFRILAILFGCSLPFLIGLVSIGITTSSLMRHIKKMKQNFSGNTCPNLQVLIKTTRTMVMFLTLSILSYIFGLMLVTANAHSLSDGTIIISSLTIASFPFIEAVIIFQAVPKLREMIVRGACVGRQWSKKTNNIT